MKFHTTAFLVALLGFLPIPATARNVGGDQPNQGDLEEELVVVGANGTDAQLKARRQLPGDCDGPDSFKYYDDILTNDEKNRMKLQHHIGGKAPMWKTTYVGTHNSYNNHDDGYFCPNNKRDMTAQLDMGLRLLSFDIHKYGNSIRLCHGICGPGDTRFRAAMDEVKTWLQGNPTEFIIIVIEDKLPDGVNIGLGRAAGHVKDVFGDGSRDNDGILYGPKGNGICTDCNRPKDLAGSWDDPNFNAKGLLDQGYRLIMVTTRGRGGKSKTWNRAVWKFGDKVVSSINAGNDLPSGNLLKADKISIVSEDLSGLNSAWHISDNIAHHLMLKGIHWFGLDFPAVVNRHASLIWSWAPSQPSDSGGDCVVQMNDGQWKNVDCLSQRGVACTRRPNADEQEWYIYTADNFYDCIGTCQAKGLIFGLPYNAYVNNLLREVHETYSGDIYLAYKWENNQWTDKTSTPNSTPYPTPRPTPRPTPNPTKRPTPNPTPYPTPRPTSNPTKRPTPHPTFQPTKRPTPPPTATPSKSPSEFPSSGPSSRPSHHPSLRPSESPSINPSSSPSNTPSTPPSDVPSSVPSSNPSNLPSSSPSGRPSSMPSSTPSHVPSSKPSSLPSELPSFVPSATPSSMPSTNPSDFPSMSPSSSPSTSPSVSPSQAPSENPSAIPSAKPSETPSDSPSFLPTDSDIVPDYIERQIDVDCPCFGEDGQDIWRNHGDYVTCVEASAKRFMEDGLLSRQQKAWAIQERARTGCGQQHKV